MEFGSFELNYVNSFSELLQYLHNGQATAEHWEAIENARHRYKIINGEILIEHDPVRNGHALIYPEIICPFEPKRYGVQIGYPVVYTTHDPHFDNIFVPENPLPAVSLLYYCMRFHVYFDLEHENYFLNNDIPIRFKYVFVNYPDEFKEKLWLNTVPYRINLGEENYLEFVNGTGEIVPKDVHNHVIGH